MKNVGFGLAPIQRLKPSFDKTNSRITPNVVFIPKPPHFIIAFGFLRNDCLQYHLVIQKTETFFVGEGSSSVPRSRGRKDGDTIWLPDGWTMEVEAKSSRQKYKLYIGPNEKIINFNVNGSDINSSPAGQKEGPVKSQTSADKYWVEDVCCYLDSKIKMSFSCNLSFGKLVLQVFDVMSQRESKVKKQEISQDYSSQQLRVYNRFLKEGRLTGCLEKLEYLDRKGLLDMSNVMVNSRIEPNVHTYGALIDGCAKAGQVAKAFGAYGIDGVHNFFATFIEVVRDRPPGHDWELEPGVTCGDYLFGMLQAEMAL
ncbi:hypothetical protein LXL04_031411 [Taraxacum kok-saghyz]